MPGKLKENPFQIRAKNSMDQGYTEPYFFCTGMNNVQKSVPEL